MECGPESERFIRAPGGCGRPQRAAGHGTARGQVRAAAMAVGRALGGAPAARRRRWRWVYAPALQRRTQGGGGRQGRDPWAPAAAGGMLADAWHVTAFAAWASCRWPCQGLIWSVFGALSTADELIVLLIVILILSSSSSSCCCSSSSSSFSSFSSS